jgi:hypothetical protein
MTSILLIGFALGAVFGGSVVAFLKLRPWHVEVAERLEDTVYIGPYWDDDWQVEE